MKRPDYTHIRTLNDLRLARMQNKMLKVGAVGRLADSLNSFRRLLTVEGMLLLALDAGKTILRGNRDFRRGYRWAQILFRNMRW